MQFIDEAANYIYMNLYDNLEKLNSQQEMLQTVANSQCILDLNDIPENDFFEALYNEDMKWYRAIVQERISVSKMRIYFVDYGNTEVYDADAVKQNKCLRKRTPIDSDLRYQAIKCVYKNRAPDSAEAFFQDATEKLIDDLYFHLRVTSMSEDTNSLIKQTVYNIDFSDDQEIDQEIVEILQKTHIREEKVLINCFYLIFLYEVDFLIFDRPFFLRLSNKSSRL